MLLVAMLILTPHFAWGQGKTSKEAERLTAQGQELLKKGIQLPYRQLRTKALFLEAQSGSPIYFHTQIVSKAVHRIQPLKKPLLIIFVKACEEMVLSIRRSSLARKETSILPRSVARRRRFIRRP
jgi:hypothetical protein